MFTLKNVAFSLGIVILIGLVQCKPEVTPPKAKKIVITDVSYDFNKDLMNMKVSLRDGPEGLPVVDLDAELFEDIPNEIYVNNVISRKTANEYKPLLKTGVKNLCEFLESPEKQPILKMLLNKLKEFGNLEFTCPMPKGTSHMEGFHIDGKSLPQAAPVGDYKMELIITRKVDNKQTPIFNMVVFATLAFKDA